MKRKLCWIFERLDAHHGLQHWWPGETPFEVMVGAVLTQNTSWKNVERAIANLVAADVLDAEKILELPNETLAELLRPSGYFNVKAARLKSFCHWYLDQGGLTRLKRLSTGRLRRELLAVKGIGPETADDILLYAFHRPVFVIDAYTRRLLTRMGLASGNESYEELRSLFEHTLDPDVPVFNQYHALIVVHGKDICRPHPRCKICCLATRCPTKKSAGF